MARALDVSHGTVGNYARRGMPLDAIEAARAWVGRLPPRRRLRCGATNGTGGTNGTTPASAIDTAGVDLAGETLESGIPRLRRLEIATAAALDRARAADKAFEAASLRKQHLDALRGLYEAETKLIKIDQARGKLASIDRTLMMIDAAFKPAVQVLRRLPELGRDAEEKQRLEAFMNAVLNEIKLGAAEGLRIAGGK